MEEGEVKQPEAPKKKKMDIKKILPVVLVVLLLGTTGGFAFLYFTQLRDMVHNSGQEEPEPRYEFRLDTFIVNLADAGQRRYLKVTMTLAYFEEDLEEELEGRVSQIRDIIIKVLRQKTGDDLQEEDAMDDIRGELVEALNKVVRGGRIERVYFTEFVIQ